MNQKYQFLRKLLCDFRLCVWVQDENVDVLLLVDQVPIS